MTIKTAYQVEDRPLTPLRGNDIPSYWLFLDTETSQVIKGTTEKHTFRIAWTCLWDRKTADESKRYQWQFWDDRQKLCEYLHNSAQDYHKLTLVGHNIYFDLQVCGFFEYFTAMKWKVRFLYDHQKSFILKCQLNDKTLICLSTTNWFDQPLRDLGEIVGLPKLSVDFSSVSQDELKTYCRRDVEILVKIMDYYLKFIKDNSLGKFSLSKASQAFTAYRYRFLHHKIRIHKDEYAVKLERDAYIGGRCEAFHIGQVPGSGFVTLDVNSMYPYVMVKYRYPVRLIRYGEGMTMNYLSHLLDHYLVIGEVEVSTPEPVFAVHYNKKTVFPVGSFTACLCTEGLKYALEHGYINNIKRTAVYLSGDLFSNYMYYFHSLKSKYASHSNDVMTTLCKYMLNSLYGKFGQKFQLEKRSECPGVHDYFREETIDMRTGKLIIRTWLMNQLITRYGEEEGRNAFVAVASHVTENARLRLWDIMNIIGRDRVLYCDTDSIKIRRCDMDKVQFMINPKQLGLLKIEDQCDSLFIGGAKWYVTEKTSHIKGIPGDAVQVSPGIYEFYSWPKMTYHLREGIIVGYHRKRVRRCIDMNYDKGIVESSGHVIPFKFPLTVLPDELPLLPF